LTQQVSRSTGAEHFSELANVKTHERLIPPCYSCPAPSEGAQIIDMLPGAKQGNSLMTARFFCKNCHPEPFQVMSYALYPHYDVMELGGGTYRLMRLTREQATTRVKGAKP